MSFNGTKESCPNYSDGELNTDYSKWVDNISDPSFRNSNFQKTCFQICGEGSYVENAECKRPDFIALRIKYSKYEICPTTR